VTGLLREVDAVTIPVPDLEAGLAFYRDKLGHEVIWRNAALGQVGLRVPNSATEIVLATTLSYEPDWRVDSVDAAAAVFAANGGRVVAGPDDIPIGRVAAVEDPFGNVLVLLDCSKGGYRTDASGDVVGVARVDPDR
jgi:catechol 2,3-dioxygenase-like lactoylglutathione lyase family enzyme